MRFSKSSLLILLCLFLLRCASQQAITGGERDETPPKLLRSTPADQTLNYKGNKIILEFDEYVISSNLRKELIISPSTDVTFTDRIKKGRILEITLDSALEENTTYTFNFRNSIQDFNEKNPAENLKIAFSTGDYIDSLQIEGTVVDLMTGLPVDDASVMLFTEDDSVTIESGKPLYLSKSDEAGNFRFENLKPDSYQLFALKEADDNLKYTKREEKIAFLAESIQLDSNKTGLELKVIDYDYKPLRWKSARANKQYFSFKFNKPIFDFTLEVKSEELAKSTFAKNLGEELRLFNATMAATDSFEVALSIEDTVGNQLDTTLFVQFEEPRKRAEEEMKLQVFPNNNQQIASGDSLQLELLFNKPLLELKVDSLFKIYAVNDSTQDTVAWNVQPALENYRTKVVFPQEAHDPKVTYLFRKGAFISVDLDTVAKQSLSYPLLNPENYGVISGKIETWAESFTIQLLANGKVEQEIKNQKNFRFQNVVPGAKSIRILVDENENGLWEKGDYKTGTLPEKVVIYQGEINLKANWELETDLIEF